jgi:hypothetical protein
MYHWLNRAPKGRNVAGVWWRRHDEYGNGQARCLLSPLGEVSKIPLAEYVHQTLGVG